MNTHNAHPAQGTPGPAAPQHTSPQAPQAQGLLRRWRLWTLPLHPGGKVTLSLLLALAGVFVAWHSVGMRLINPYPHFLRLWSVVLDRMHPPLDPGAPNPAMPGLQKMFRALGSTVRLSGFPLGWTFTHTHKTWRKALTTLVNEANAVATAPHTSPQDKELAKAEEAGLRQVMKILDDWSHFAQVKHAIHIPLSVLWKKETLVQAHNKVALQSSDGKSFFDLDAHQSFKAQAQSDKPLWAETQKAISVTDFNISSHLRARLDQRGGVWELNTAPTDTQGREKLVVSLNGKPAGAILVDTALPSSKVPERVDFWVTPAIFKPLDPDFYPSNHPIGSFLATKEMKPFLSELTKTLTPSGVRLVARQSYITPLQGTSPTDTDLMAKALPQGNPQGNPQGRAPKGLPAGLLSQWTLTWGDAQLDPITWTLVAKSRDRLHVGMFAPLTTVNTLIDKAAASSGPEIMMLKLLLPKLIPAGKTHITLTVELSSAAKNFEHKGLMGPFVVPYPQETIDILIKNIFGL